MFAEGNDVERHLDRPPGASLFPDWVEQASAKQGSSENSHVSQSWGIVGGGNRKNEGSPKEPPQDNSTNHLRQRLRKMSPERRSSGKPGFL